MHTAGRGKGSCAALAAMGMMTLLGCGSGDTGDGSSPQGAFAADLAFLREHVEVIVLSHGADQAQVAVVPEYQGRVMTSTTDGQAGPSFGWIRREAVASGERVPHINVFGGEDRFWLGPEGGQYALYFAPGDPFDLEHWQVPEPIDWGAWAVTGQAPTEAGFERRMHLVNYSGSSFDLEVERTVRLLAPDSLDGHLGVAIPPAVRSVAFESSNTVTNIGAEAWQEETGLLSIWILGMFNPSPTTTVVLPFTAGDEASRGPVVNDAYFGKVPADRLVVRDGILFFRGDGRHRSKIGLSPARARPIAGSYDAAGRVLTLVQYTQPPGATAYVNSMWEIQQQPYRGDVINSYNDGPPAPGAPPLGPFYELETSSPALALATGERYTHVHRTMHLVGSEADLDRIARAVLGVGLADVASAFQASASP